MLFWYDENSSPIGFVYTDKTTETPTSQTSYHPKGTYTYSSSEEWKDKLLTFNGNPITYDASDNPIIKFPKEFLSLAYRLHAEIEIDSYI